MFYKDERIAVFIDGLNFHSAARIHNIHVDYRKLRSEFASRGKLVRCFYYAVEKHGDEDVPIRRLLDYLDYNGFTLKTETVKHDDIGAVRRAKSCLLMELAMDAISLAGRVDHFVILCGDREILPLVEALKRSGTRVSICATRQGIDGGTISDDLRRAADNFIELAELANMIDRQDRAA